MSSPAIPVPSARLVLADRVIPRSWVTDVLLVAAGVALTAGLAQVSVPLYPVPVTGQTLAVLLVGASLGTVRAAVSMIAYAVVGIIGIPVFSDASSGPGVLAGPTGGYIVGFIASAALVGWLSERAWDRKIVKAAVVFLAGTVVTFVFGLAWLLHFYGGDIDATLRGGLYPFLIGGALKAAIASGLLPLAWKLTTRR